MKSPEIEKTCLPFNAHGDEPTRVITKAPTEDGVADDATLLIVRVEALRESLRTMLDHANRTMSTSHALRLADDQRHRLHVQEIDSMNRTMQKSARDSNKLTNACQAAVKLPAA